MSPTTPPLDTASPCLDENDAMRVVLNPEDPRVAVARAHLDGCEACRELVAAVARFVVGDDTSTGAPWTDAPLSPGTTIDAYRILDTLGQGAMGRVYRAHDTRLDRTVALKLLDPSLQDGAAQQRVTAEARSMAQLQHANVVDVFDVGTSDYGPYVAMAYVDGWDLGGWLGDKHRSISEIIACLTAAGHGLAAAHAAGVVHRDFKPANVLVGRDGSVSVADFGLALATATAQRDGADEDPSRIAGTPAYMAPEQRRGEPCGPAVDQFAYCVTLYEALAGHRPFPESSSAARRKAIEARQLRPPGRTLPAQVLNVLRRGLQPEPGQRFADMPALLAALSKPGAARWKLGAAAALVAIAAASVVWSPDLAVPKSCGAETPAPWSAIHRERVQAAWKERGAPAYTTTRLLQQLDAYAEGWTELHRRTCVAVAPAPTPKLQARLDCLEQARADLELFVSAAATATKARAEGFASTAAKLRPASDCVDDVSWVERPKLAAEVDQLRSRHLRDAAQGPTEQRDVLHADTIAALAKAEDAGAGIEQARLAELVGTLESRQNKHASASEWFQRAYFLARANAAPAQAFDAAAASGLMLGTHLHNVPEARAWFRHARSALGDLEDTQREALLLLYEGDLHMLTSDLDAALLSYRAVEALIPKGVPADVPTSLYGSLGQLLAMRGEDAPCREAFQNALSHGERELGATHRSLIRPLLGIATCERDPEFYDAGLEHLNRAIKLSQRHAYVMGEAMARGNLGIYYRMLEQPTASLRELLLSDALLRKTYPEGHFVLGQSQRDLALAHLATGQWSDAAVAAASATQILEAQAFDAESLLYDCALIIAHTDVMLDRVPQGTTSPTTRLEQLVTRTPSDRPRAAATLALAEARLAIGHNEEVSNLLALLYDEDAPVPEISIVRLAEGRLIYAQALLAQGETRRAQAELELALAGASPYERDDPRNVVQRIREQQATSK